MSRWPTARCGSSKTRSTSRRGGLSAPGATARGSRPIRSEPPRGALQQLESTTPRGATAAPLAFDPSEATMRQCDRWGGALVAATLGLAVSVTVTGCGGPSQEHVQAQQSTEAVGLQNL